MFRPSELKWLEVLHPKINPKTNVPQPNQIYLTLFYVFFQVPVSLLYKIFIQDIHMIFYAQHVRFYMPIANHHQHFYAWHNNHDIAHQPRAIMAHSIDFFTNNIISFTWRPVCLLESSFLLESEFRGKWIPRKYFPMFGSIIKNKLENTFQYLVMSWKMSWKITY